MKFLPSLLAFSIILIVTLISVEASPEAVMAFSPLMLLCACPEASEIADIPHAPCPENFGQVQKVLFQRMASGGTPNEMTQANAILEATWTALVTATDSTKVQASPYIQEPSNEAGAKREYGGGNATLGGIPITLGREASTFEGKVLQTSQAVIAALKAYECEAAIGVYLINEDGQIAGSEDTTGSIAPFPIRGVFVGDKTLGGFENVDYNAISWSFLPNWSDKWVVVTPTAFDPLTDLHE